MAPVRLSSARAKASATSVSGRWCVVSAASSSRQRPVSERPSRTPARGRRCRSRTSRRSTLLHHQALQVDGRGSLKVPSTTTRPPRPTTRTASVRVSAAPPTLSTTTSGRCSFPHVDRLVLAEHRDTDVLGGGALVRIARRDRHLAGPVARDQRGAQTDRARPRAPAPCCRARHRPRPDAADGHGQRLGERRGDRVDAVGDRRQVLQRCVDELGEPAVAAEPDPRARRDRRGWFDRCGRRCTCRR